MNVKRELALRFKANAFNFSKIIFITPSPNFYYTTFSNQLFSRTPLNESKLNFTYSKKLLGTLEQSLKSD